MKGFLNVTVLVLVLLGALGVLLYTTSNLIARAPQIQSTSVQTTMVSTIPYAFPVSTPVNSSVGNVSPPSSNQVIAYALQVLNSERSEFGLQNVTLSNETSGQQHADSMLYYDYFSHWDPFGMKPYMRYTLLGGNEGVTENIAYVEQVNESCLGPICSLRPINVTAAIGSMNYQMIYNDSACCGNGHRNNTLDPNHNEVSIGVAYNKTTVYLVEDFINDYIEWLNQTPGVGAVGGMIYLNGLLKHDSTLSSVQIDYDPLPQNMSDAQLAATKSYGQGTLVAGVAYGRYYYQNLQTVYATYYKAKGDSFNIAFNLSSVIAEHGAGVYTVDIYLNNSAGKEFLASTYSVFIGSSGQPYLPGYV